MHLRQCRWSDEAAHRLAVAVVGADQLEWLAERVKSGQCMLLEVDAHSLVVLELQCGTLFVHVYVGRKLIDFARVVYVIARQNKAREIHFESPEPHTLKLLKMAGYDAIDHGAYFCVRVHPLYRRAS